MKLKPKRGINVMNLKNALLSFCLSAAPALLAARPALAVPEFPKDSLAGCRELESAGAVPLPQAVGVVQACLDNVYGQRSYSVTARAGRFGVSVCPAPSGPGAATCFAMREVEGVVVSVDGELLTGDPVLMDLRYSIQRRGGELLGWNAIVDDKTRAPQGPDPNPAVVVPAWLDRSSLRLDAAKTGMIGVDGGFEATLTDRDGNEVRFLEPSPILRGARTTVEFVRATGGRVGPSPLEDGMFHPNPGAAQLAVLVAGVEIPSSLSPAAQQAVRELFDGLKRLS